jgi:histidinol-phosphatase
VAFEPVANRMYRALRGEGAYRDDRKIHVSKVDRLADSLMSYSGMKYFQKANKEQQYVELLSRVDRARGYGDYFGFVLVAQGSCEIMLDHGVHIWDVAGLQVIVEEAGGKLTDWEGGRNDLYRPDCVATNGLVHEEALAILN